MNEMNCFMKDDDTLENRCLAQINIAQKNAFYESFKEAIAEGDFQKFSGIVHLVGEMWGVLRTIVSEENKEESEKVDFGTLCNELWKEKKAIINGKYEIHTDRTKWPTSYVSKICFLIAPEHYKIIYDENNRTSLAEVFSSEKITENKLKDAGIFKEYVERYYSENKLPCSQDDIDDIFETDCKLWIHGKELKKELSKKS